MTAQPLAYHAMTMAGRDLFRAEAVCGKRDIPAHRLMIPTSANLTAFISCRDCRAAFCYPKDMDERKGSE